MTRKQSPTPAPSPGTGASGSVGAQSHRPATQPEPIAVAEWSQARLIKLWRAK